MKVAILGYGVQGRAAYDYWHPAHEVTICDRNEQLELPPGARGQLGPEYLNHLDRFDLLVRSPALHPNDITAANTPAILDKVTTVTNEFLRVCPTRNVIGVTGTKGKGTTCTLIARLLEAAGQRVHLGGNIGTPPLALLADTIQANDWVVLELANFQLIDLRTAPHIAVCLMVVPEHLDWHGTTKDYEQAKAQLFVHQTADDIAIYYADNEASQRIAAAGAGQKIPYYAPPGALIETDAVMIDGKRLCSTTDLKLLGKHNWQNVCAAVTAVWQITQDADAIRSVLTSFGGLPYRLELRREAAGVRYYNDSFAASPHTPIAAIEAVPSKKVMIIGGFDRHLKLDNLAADLVRLQDQVRKILLIGASADRTAQVLKQHGFTNFEISKATDMAAIVRQAAGLAQTGDAVVLSPGFPSFDMFKNFEERGRAFNQAVEQL